MFVLLEFSNPADWHSPAITCKEKLSRMLMKRLIAYAQHEPLSPPEKTSDSSIYLRYAIGDAPCRKPSSLLLGLLLLLNLTSQSVPLCLDSLLSPLTSSLGLRTLGVHLILQDPLTLLLSLGLVDMLNQRSLVLEGVTLAQVIQLVVKVLIDLARGAVFDEKAT